MMLRGPRTRSIVCVVAVVLGSCGGPQTQLPLRQAQGDTERALAKTTLIYASDANSNTVDVYDYTDGTQVGTLTGFQSPNGGCVDAKGDVFIVNFLSGVTDEFAHGGTKVHKKYRTSGYAIGCSVDRSGDLAVTDSYSSTGPGSICVWKGGKGSAKCSIESSGQCYFLQPGGYDDKGNLYVAGDSQNGKAALCELPTGTGNMSQVPVTGAPLDFPGSVMWDGKYLALTDQDYHGMDTTAIYQLAESPSGGVNVVNQTGLLDPCGGVSVVQPFIVGTKNTPANRTQGTTVIGNNTFCGGDLTYWSYPRGGNQIATYSIVTTSVVVSIGT